MAFEAVKTTEHDDLAAASTTIVFRNVVGHHLVTIVLLDVTMPLFMLLMNTLMCAFHLFNTRAWNEELSCIEEHCSFEALFNEFARLRAQVTRWAPQHANRCAVLRAHQRQ